MKILITGCAGYIGSKLSNHYLQNGYHVYGIDNLSIGKIENIPKGVKFIKKDLRDNDLSEKLPKEIDFIIHLAAQSGGDKSFNDILFDLSSNVIATVNILQYSQKINAKKIIFSSSMAVYGDSDYLVSENSPKNPLSFYGNTKLTAENYIRIFQKEFGLNYNILRFFNVYGPNQDSKGYTQGIVSIFTQQAIDNKSILVKGSGSRERDFVHIDDVIQSIDICIDRKDTDNKTFNVGFGKSYKVKYLVDGIVKRIPFDLNVVYEGRTRGDINKIKADISLLRKYGYKPNWNLDDGLDDVFKSLIL